MERNEIKCKCQDCGKEFRHGEQGDNDEYCLRCIADWRASLREDFDCPEEP